MDTSIEDLLQNITEPNRTPALTFWQELQTHIPDAAGATKSHQAWPGGYKDHIQEVMNLARILYERLNQERKLKFALESAYLVLFLHDCEKPFRHASDEQLKAFPWIITARRKVTKYSRKSSLNITVLSLATMSGMLFAMSKACRNLNTSKVTDCKVPWPLSAMFATLSLLEYGMIILDRRNA